MSELPENEMNWTSQDIEAAEGILGKASPRSVLLPQPKPEVLLTLTDEEIRVLDGPQHDQLVAMPWLDANGSDDSETVNKVAMRGLIARGLVSPLGFDQNTEEMIVDVPDTIRGPLVLRRTGDKVVAITLNTSLGQQWVYGYVHVPDPEVDHVAVLSESVSEAGMHEFTISGLKDFVSLGANLLDPSGNAHRDSEAVSYTVAEFENGGQGLPELADSRVVTTVAVAGPGIEGETKVNVITFYADTSTLRLLTQAGDSVLLCEVTLESAERAIGELIGAL